MGIAHGTRYSREIGERAVRLRCGHQGKARTFVTAATAAVVLAVPAPAPAATKTVQMGLPPSAQKPFDRLRSDVSAFFPSTVKVRVGSAVRFVPSQPRTLGPPRSLLGPRRPNVGFHTVDLPAKGGGPLPLVVSTGVKVVATDAAGSQFWFRGFDLSRLNPTLRVGALGKTVRYDGSKRRISGLAPANKRKPVTIRFTKAGTYTYYCNIHAGMKGTVRVLPKGRRVPTPAADRKAVNAQVREALRTAKALVSRRVARNVMSVGRAGAGGVDRYAFSPASLKVPTGRTVKFAMPVGSREAHTATTGPGNPRDESSYLGKLARSIESPNVNPIAVFPSEPPTLGAVGLTPRLHGNGFWNSGVMDAFAPSPLPADNSLTFRRAGTYRFYCLIDPYMRATVEVIPRRRAAGLQR